MATWQLGNSVPRIHPTAYVHPSAQVIGDVTLGAHSSVWPCAVLRADFGPIDVGEGSTIEDNCIVHPRSRKPSRIGSECVIGHGVHLEDVVIEDAVLIGSRSILLSGARVRTGAAVAAGALVLEDTEIPKGHRAQGVPARLVRSDHDPELVREGARRYRALAQRYAELKATGIDRRAAAPAQSEALAHLRLASDVARMDVDELAVPLERDVVVDGLRLHCLDWGYHDCPPLLFLHGGCLTAHTWDLVCLALRRDFHCLAVDLRGHGDSEWSPSADYGPDAHLRDLRGLIEQLGLARLILVGHSLGGLNAMLYARSAPERVAGVVLVDVGPEPQSIAVKRITDFVMGDPASGSVEDFVDRACAFNPRRDQRLLRYSLRHNLRQLPDGSWTWKYDRRLLSPERFASVRRSLAELPDRISAITCPVLVVRGAESDAFDDAQAARFAAALHDGRWAKVESAGHTVQGDNPRGLVEVLANFLAEIGS